MFAAALHQVLRGCRTVLSTCAAVPVRMYQALGMQTADTVLLTSSEELI